MPHPVSSSPRSPQGEQLLTEFRLSGAIALQWMVLALAGFLISLLLLGALYAGVTGEDTVQFGGPIEWASSLVAFLLFGALFLITIPIHELIHGVVMKLYGGKPRYGLGVAHFLLPYAYATSSHRFTRNQMIQVAIAPLVVITLLGTIPMLVWRLPWLAIPLAANAAGAIGDIWMAVMLLQYPPSVRVEDRQTGLRIYGRPGDRVRPSSPAKFFRDCVIGAGASLGGLIIILSLLPIGLEILGVESWRIGIPATNLQLFEFSTEAGISAVFHFPSVLALSGLLGLLYGLVRAGQRSQRHSQS